MAHENHRAKPQRHSRALVTTLTATAVFALTPVATRAGSPSSGSLPWDQPLNAVGALLTGPIAHTFIAFVLAVAFIMYGVQGNCELARRLLKAGFATAVAVESVKLLNYLLPY